MLTPSGATWLLDIGLEDARFATEYDGEEFHGEDQRDHDDARRDWLRRERQWTIVVIRKKNLFGHLQDVHHQLWSAAVGVGLLRK